MVAIVCEAALVLLPPGLAILDARFHYSGDDALAFLNGLGEVGRRAYSTHQWVDLAFIASYTTFLYAAVERFSVRRPLALRVTAFLPGAFDLIETVGILVLLATFERPGVQAFALASLVGTATTLKWCSFGVLVAAFLRTRMRRTPGLPSRKAQ